jgi:hypothetical protein
MLTKSQAAQAALQCFMIGTASDSDKELVKQVKNEFKQGILPIFDSLHNFCIYRCISRSLLGQLSGGRRARIYIYSIHACA